MLASDIIRSVSRSFGDTDLIVCTNPDYFDWINAGMTQIVKDTECLSTHATAAANTFPLAFPTNFLRIRRVIYGQIPLQYVDIEDLDDKQQNLSTQDVPVYFYVNLNKINLFPLQTTTDTTIVSYDYTSIPSVISTTNATLDLPNQYQDTLHNFVLAKARERNEDYRGVDYAMNRYKENIANDRDDTLSRDDSYPIIRDDPIDAWYDW